MKLEEVEKLEKFLSDSFGDGVHIRELRLSNEEAEYIKRSYPEASFNKSHHREMKDGKAWYKVALLPAINPDQNDEILAIKQENIKLKQEIDILRRSMTITKRK
ncbi:hypothetical protein J2Z40_003025 [Cytobacillus eiseniae]|uniref:Uncharacterized protein n=1 Tax=Cytobacillus eiseniae TaxID=762947 RepID=A0ABS4RHV1_9BACI|nr:hypothetical protein [Cytobacillus eiseniae]MBP2242451.1 hypothetical protein [Cytobacillus eiseniae]